MNGLDEIYRLDDKNQADLNLLKYLISPLYPESDPYWKNPIGTILINYRGFVCGEFVRKSINKHFELMKMPRQFPKELKILIQLEADLWGKTWRLIRLLKLKGIEPEAILFGLIIEHALLLSTFFSSSQLEAEDEAMKENFRKEATKKKNVGKGATQGIRLVQKENRAMEGKDNPFDPKVTTTTWKFVAYAIAEAEKNPDFNKDYVSMVNARMTLTSYWISTYPKKVDEFGRIEKRGRSRKN